MSYLGQDPSLEVCLSAQHHLPVCSAPSLLSFLALLCRLLPLGPEDPRNPSASPQVLSGCAIIVRGQPRGGPPPERQINLSNIRAGNLARRAAAGQPDAKDTPDEVGASHEQCRAAPPLSQGSRVELDGGCVCVGGVSRLLAQLCRPQHPRPTHCKGRCPFPDLLLPSHGAQTAPSLPALVQDETVSSVIL